MSDTVQLTLPIPRDLAHLTFPKALDDRLHFLLDEQGRCGELRPSERDEAEALTQMARLLTMLKLGAAVESKKL